MRAENGALNATIQPDVNGQGGTMTLMHDSANAGVVLDGATGTGASMTLVGGPATMQLRSDVSGDNSVILPNSSINSFETGAETGAASAKAFASGALQLNLAANVQALYLVVN